MNWFTARDGSDQGAPQSTEAQQLPSDGFSRGSSSSGTSGERSVSGVPDGPVLGCRQPSVLEYIRGDGEFGGMAEIPVTVEEPWNEGYERQLGDWKDEAVRSAQDHNKAGYRLKHKYRLGGFVTISWGLVVLLVNGLLSCDDQAYAKAFTVFVNAVNVSIIALFSTMNLGQAYQEHFEYEARFLKFADDIRVCLIRGREYRIPADAFVTGINERIKNLRSAPEMPRSRYFFC